MKIGKCANYMEVITSDSHRRRDRYIHPHLLNAMLVKSNKDNGDSKRHISISHDLYIHTSTLVVCGVVCACVVRMSVYGYRG